MSQKKVEDTPGAYAAGVVTLVLAAVVGFFMSLYVMGMSPAAWGFSGFISFPVALFGGPVWLIVGIWCFVAIRKVSDSYKTDLLLLGLLNIGCIVFTAFLPIFYKYMLLVWFIAYGLAFGCLIFLAYCRKTWRVNKRKKGTSKSEWNGLEKIERGLGKVGDVTGSIGIWLGRVTIVAILVISVVMICVVLFSEVFFRE